MFYISAYFEAHRDAYYDGPLAVSRDDGTGNRSPVYSFPGLLDIAEGRRVFSRRL